MTSHWPAEWANQREKDAKHRDEATLEATRRADADQLAHEQSEIEAARVDQESLQNVRVPAEVHTAHPAGFVEVSERAFESLTAAPQQTLAARATDASTIAVHDVAGVGVLLPFASSAIGFGDVAADADGLEIERVDR